MNIPAQNTDSLRDIHLPDAISWWPPAIGWWILLALVIAAFIFIPKLYRRVTYTSLNKVANKTYQNIVDEFKENNNDSAFIIATSQFLRQTAMSYCGREDVAQLTGDIWVGALNDIIKQEHFTYDLKQSLVHAPYQKNNSIDTEKLINAVQSWLNKLPKQTQRLNK